MEIIQLVRAISTDMECPQCKRGRMRPLGIVIGQPPPNYAHICTACGFKCEFDKAYPTLVQVGEGEVLKVEEE